MTLDDIKWKKSDEKAYWREATLNIRGRKGYILQALRPECHSKLVHFRVGDYHVTFNDRTWNFLGPLELQCVLNELTKE